LFEYSIHYERAYGKTKGRNEENGKTVQTITSSRNKNTI
jgi:hypothetical protein